MTAASLRLLLLLVVATTPAHADNCADSQAMVGSGQQGLVSFRLGQSMAKQLCTRILQEPSPDPAMVKQCQQLGQLSANAGLQDSNVQAALDKFEKTFDIPKDEFLGALANGSLRELMAGKGIPDDQLDSALANAGPAAVSSQTATNTSSLSGTEDRAPAAKKAGSLRDKLKAKLAQKTGAEAKTEEQQSLDGLTPSYDDSLVAGSHDDAGELTIFDVVHLRYKALTPRMKPGKVLAP